MPRTFLALFLVAASARAGADVQIWLECVDLGTGEGGAVDPETWVALAQFDYKIEVPTSAPALAGGGGAAVAKARGNEFLVRKRTDGASAALAGLVLTGAAIRRVTVAIVDVGTETTTELGRFTFEDVQVMTIGSAEGGAHGELPLEEVRFQFGRYTQTVGGATSGYDFKNNIRR